MTKVAHPLGSFPIITARRGSKGGPAEAVRCGRGPVALFAILGLMLSATIAIAEPTGRRTPFDGRLAPGDQVVVTVFDQPDISGTYLIETDGTVTMPLIGPVPAADTTTQEFRASLARRLSDGYLQNPVVNVRIAELRPVTVTGDVRTPGRITFMNGMTAAMAASLAGSSSRPNAEENVLRADFLQADERLTSLRVSRLSILVRLARLKAQMDLSKEIVPPAVEDRDAALLKRMMAGESAVFASQSQAREQELQLLQQQITERKSEVESFSEQIALQNEQIALLDGLIQDFNSLLVNGLTRKSAVVDIQREKTRSRADLARILSDLTRAKMALDEFQLRAKDLENSYRNRLTTESQEASLRLIEIESALPVAEEVRQARLNRAPQAVLIAGPSLRVTRYENGSIVTFDADGSTPVWPGDIVQVEGLPPAPAGFSATPPVLPTAPQRGLDTTEAPRLSGL